MRITVASGLSMAVALAVGFARAEEYHWRPALGTPTPLAPSASLGRPVPLTATSAPPAAAPAVVDHQVRAAAYSPAELAAPRPIVRAQSPDFAPPTLAPPPPPGGPPAPDERYNCGVVTEPPAPAANGLFSKVGNWFSGIGFGDQATPGGRAWFQSDQCFPEFISPVTNPFLFEDPRALTEVRPIFIYQATPTTTPGARGGDVEFAGVQARLAVNERLSFVINKLGWIWDEPHEALAGEGPHVGFAELWLGPKYTFLRNDSTKTLGAVGLTFQIPTGSAKVFQDTGSLSLTPYVSLGQHFLKTPYGSFNALDTLGYTVSVDNKRSDYLFDSFHLDFDVLDLHKIYPLLELNYFLYTSAGNDRPLNFEGRDLFNFGSTGVSGENQLSIAGGARYKVNENLQAGLAAEFPISGHHDLLDWRITVDLIFRY
jgi:hypothetical protein